MKYILSSAAAIALAASGALAQPNKDKGNDRGERDRPAASVEKRGGDSAVKEQRGSQRSAQQDRRTQDRGKARVEERQDRRVEGRTDARVKERADQRQDRRADRRDDRRDDRRFDRSRDIRDRIVDHVVFRDERVLLSRDRNRGLIAGCPPGLAKKYNGCMPPGQAKKRYYERAVFGYGYRPGLFGLSHYPSGRYFYDDGFLLRIGNGGSISGYIPLLGGALAIGNRWPSSYSYYPVPNYYVDYYNLGPANRYRYADNVIYRVDPEDTAILGVAALLTGDDIQIGRPMPVGYDVYNVPYAYRDRYYDTPDARYRYSDGYVYRIDPATQLVAAAIDLLV
ncbi:hypothetical protein [Erythrobacter mangrovi]|uniref:RcnB family protein n=1 Tax=Erythrobacter mangrovi TaxID=2739433 RepID=A0A7D4BEH7_9SPHN|nr:hypothetical protein [Erythrobacter mangrovi]QKG69882.1 hypothetical protein HQR01_01555 [Erythrobacter mangrovi]